MVALLAPITDTCGDCEADLEHCHGTVAVHRDGRTECLDDPDCRRPLEAHLTSIDCGTAGCAEC